MPSFIDESNNKQLLALLELAADPSFKLGNDLERNSKPMAKIVKTMLEEFREHDPDGFDGKNKKSFKEA